MAADYKNNLNELKAASACYLPQCLGEADRLALEVIVAMKDLAVVPNGVNYSVPALMSAASLWIHQLSKAERSAVAFYIDLQNAIDDGAQFANGTGVSGLRKDAKCLQASCVGQEELRNLLLFLKWKLNKVGQAL